MSDRFERAARLVHALGEAGGALPAARLTTFGDAPDLESALATLGDLVSLETDGTLRFGPRGSALAAADVQASLGGATWGRELEVLATIGSTNDRAAERAAAGAAPGLVVTAELQTAGRGRRGRVFDSRPGLGIWSTTLLPVPADPAAAPRLSLIAALAVAEAVEERTGFSPALKWPNDVRIGGRKICGVLVEARSAGGRVFPVAGIGINVHHRPQDFPPEVAPFATSVEEATRRHVGRSELLATLIARLERKVAAEVAGRLDLADEFARRDEWLGRSVSIEVGGGERVEGTARGVDATGALRLDVPGRGEVRVISGEASLVLSEES